MTELKLHIPEQKKPAKDAFASHPRKLKKWLAELPYSNMGEMTRQLYSALRDLNRQMMPGKHRLEDMEMLREPLRNIFSNLEKHFINRTLPLPEKSQKTVYLYLSLLQEISFGYKIIVYEAANAIDKKIDTKSQNIAILRALRYMSELLLKTSEIYEPYPVGIWYDLHQMYNYAAQKGFHTKLIADVEYIHSKASIEDYYKQVMLFALARPIAMRQSDTVRVYNKLAEWSSLTKLGCEADETRVNRFFCARIKQDCVPDYLSLEDCEDPTQIRTLDTSELVETIRIEVNASRHNAGQITVGDQISAETLQVLAMAWGVCTKRRFSRAEKSGHIKAAIGLVNAARHIAGKVEPEEVEKENEPPIMPGKHKQLDISLAAIPEDFKASESQVTSAYVTHHEIGKDYDDAWDMVAKGKALTDTFIKEKEFLRESQLKLNKELDKHWQIVNVSAGGYCLRWHSDTPSRAQIGEPIALLENEPNGIEVWRIGVIRWMQFIRKSGLVIGVQVLSPKVFAATTQRSNRPNEEPFECLLLPGIKPLKQPASVLLPAHAFKSGDKLKINVKDHKSEVKLNSIREHTGSFTQFQYTSLADARAAEQGNKNKQSSKNDNDYFDEIWSTL
ncbi:MAG: hypothetical protein HKP12_04500 [Gammaproteobacteria bacterium]|nr:hypothetical protein [Gammaproteobacteria bacterium]NNJ96399.1 hypothetical protein [Gammaproteobacteria bacterium]